jgi:glycosyltransferase involved in cell wall biosynthesis
MTKPIPEPAVPVAFVSSHATRGGAERYLALLLEHLPREWIRSVVTLKHGGFVDDLREDGLPVEVIDTGPGVKDIVRSARRLRRSLASSRPAVIHANGLKAALVAELATIGLRTPVIWFKHDVAFDGWRARLVARRAAKVIGASAAVLETIGAQSDRVEVLHYQMPDPYVDSDSARRRVTETLGCDGSATVVALVGRLDGFKGQSELIEVAPAILARAPETRFLLVGGEDPAHPGQQALLEHEVRDRGLGHAVTLTGHRTDALELISGSDILAIPSIAKGPFGKEGFPFVGLEALALRTPIVCYAHGGLPEQVGECGLLVPPGDRSALGEAILRLVFDPGLRAELAACGRKRFEQRFLWSTLAADVAARYRAVAVASSRAV